MHKTDIRSLNLIEMEKFFVDMGEAKFRGKQVFSWIHQKLATDFSQMTNVSKDLQNKLMEISFISLVEIVEKRKSLKDDTIKYLFQLEKETIIESVLMKYSYGNTVCVSTQAGCRMGCSFCASAIGGLDRNLSAGEIAAQITEIEKDLGERVSNVVLMGCGEPFDNYENVLKFIDIINCNEGLNIGQRSITISTCGLIDEIYDFTERKTQVNLAISLHAPNNKLRNEIMPINRKYDMNSLIKACNDYTEKTKRRVTYEYALIEGVNDSVEQAKELAIKIKSTLCHVNLIPMNFVSENDFKGSTREKAEEFAEVLRKFKIETTIRRKIGSDIDAACGQLRWQYSKDRKG